MTNDQITVSRELLRQVLESLYTHVPYYLRDREPVITALRTAMEQPSVETVARVIWPSVSGLPSIEWLVDASSVTAGMALFAAPQTPKTISELQASLAAQERYKPTDNEGSEP